MNDDRSAFPVFDSTRAGTDFMCVAPGMTLRQYAAIKLKVPRSGDPDINAMIRESRRDEFMRAALAGLLMCPFIRHETSDGYAIRARGIANAMLAEMDKKAKK